MHISWLGATAIRLQTKPFDQDVVVIIDPYQPALGLFQRSVTPQIALYSHGIDGSITLSGNPFVLDTPGECDVSSVLVTAIAGDDGKSIMFRIDAEGMSLAHLGMATKPPTEKQREVLGNADILFVPVGGAPSYDTETAIKVVNDLEPRVVIPIYFQSDNDPKAASVDKFLKEMGIAAQKTDNKVILKKKDLPTEDTQVIVLSKE